VEDGYRSWRRSGAAATGSSTAEASNEDTASPPSSSRASSLRQQWQRQRSVALQPLGSAAASGSRAAAAAALDSRSIVDVLSGKRLRWEQAVVSYECMDGAFATGELAADLNGKGESTVVAGRRVAGMSKAAALLHKVWRGTCPPSGSMWKRIKFEHAEDS
jgi:hypothetical protein